MGPGSAPQLAEATLKAADELGAARACVARTASEQTGRGEGGRKGLAPLGLRRTFSGEAGGRQAQQKRDRGHERQGQPRTMGWSAIRGPREKGHGFVMGFTSYLHRYPK